MQFNPNLLAFCVFLGGLAVVWYRPFRKTVGLRLSLLLGALPLLGRERALLKPTMRSPVAPGAPIVHAEAAFVQPLLPYIGFPLARAAFDNLVAYIRKAEDSSVTPHAAPLLLSLAMLLAIPEGWSAGFVLLPWISPDITATERDFWAGATGYVLAAVFYVLAHWAGGLARRAKHAAPHYEAYLEDGQRRGALTPPEIAPSDVQSKDDQAPSYEQFFARATTRVWSRGAVFLCAVLVAFGVAITVLRFVGMQTDEARAAAYQLQLSAQTGVSPVSVAGSGVAAVVGNVVALGIFLLSFGCVQAIGFLVGYQTKPNGSRTEEAYKVLDGCMTFELYQQHYQERLAYVEKAFASFQSRLVVRGRAHAPSLRAVLTWLQVEHQDGPPDGSSSAPIPFDAQPLAPQGGALRAV